MTKASLLLAGSVLALSACAGREVPPPSPPSAFAAAVLVEEEVPEPTPPSSPVVQSLALAEQRLPRPSRGSPRERRAPTSRVEAANRAAVREPSSQGYVNATQVYAWSEGAVYRLYTAPEQVSEIALQPGETLISVAAGDTVRWIIGDTTSGSGAGRRTHGDAVVRGPERKGSNVPRRGVASRADQRENTGGGEADGP